MGSRETNSGPVNLELQAPETRTTGQHEPGAADPQSTGHRPPPRTLATGHRSSSHWRRAAESRTTGHFGPPNH
eukprot:9317188-Pyramimonas_sp.AAC.1